MWLSPRRAVIALGEIGLAAKEALPTLAKLATNNAMFGAVASNRSHREDRSKRFGGG